MRVARRRAQSLRQTAIAFGISESCLNRWRALDEIEAGGRPGVPKAEAVEPRELKKRNKILEEENLILHRAAALFAKEMLPNDVPARCRSRR